MPFRSFDIWWKFWDLEDQWLFKCFEQRSSTLSILLSSVLYFPNIWCCIRTRPSYPLSYVSLNSLRYNPTITTFPEKGLLELEKLCQRKTSFKEVIKQGQPLSDIRIQHSRSQNGIYVFYFHLAPILLADNRSSSSSSLWVSVIIIIIIFILSNLSVVKLKIELNQKLEEI